MDVGGGSPHISGNAGNIEAVVAPADGLPAPTARGLDLLGVRSAGVARAAVATFCGALAPLSVTAPRVGVTLAVAALWAAWNVVGLALPGDRPWRGRLVADVLVLSTVCLSQRWTVSAADLTTATGWVLAVASVTVVTYQWHTTLRAGLTATVVVACAYNAGCLLPIGAGGPAPRDTLPMGVWIVVEAALSRGLFVLVARGGRRAEAIIAEEQRRRVGSAVAAARRADSREYLTMLHDTAAATLLMIGGGLVDGRSRWLTEQAARDLEAVAGRRDRDAATGDLREQLRAARRSSRLDVDWHDTGLPDVPQSVAVAMGNCVREALTNVERHAGVDAARIVTGSHAGRVVLEIEDRGRGFDPGAVPPGRRGLAHSVVGRMARVGGTADVESRPGDGTRIVLTWPGEPRLSGPTPLDRSRAAR